MAQALDVALGTAQRGGLAERPTTNSAAYDAYLKGEEASVWSLNVADPPSSGGRSSTSSRRSRWTRISPWHGRRGRGHTRCSTSTARPAGDRDAGARIGGAGAGRSAPNQPGRLPRSGELLPQHPVSIRVAHARPTQAQSSASRSRRATSTSSGPAALVEQHSASWATRLAQLLRSAGAGPPLGRHRPAARANAALPPPLSRGARRIRPRPVRSIREHGDDRDTAMIFAAQGDLAGARRGGTAGPLPKSTRPPWWRTSANFYDLYWILDDDQRTLLYQLKPADFETTAALGHGAGAAVPAARRPCASPGLLGLRAAGVRRPGSGPPRRCPEPRVARPRAGLPRAQGRSDPRGSPRVALQPITPTPSSDPTSSTSSSASTSRPASPRKRWTGSSRCSGSPTTCRRHGSGSIRRSIRCGRTRGFRRWRRGMMICRVILSGAKEAIPGCRPSLRSG